MAHSRVLKLRGPQTAYMRDEMALLGHERADFELESTLLKLEIRGGLFFIGDGQV